jgi:hypothetical protein
VCSGRLATVVIAPADYDRAGAAILEGRSGLRKRDRDPAVVTRNAGHFLLTGVGVVNLFCGE